MRRILVERARKKARARHGSGLKKTGLVTRDCRHRRRYCPGYSRSA
jgi:hypothetical protein